MNARLSWPQFSEKDCVRLINNIGPALRALLASGEQLKLVSFDNSEKTLQPFIEGGSDNSTLVIELNPTDDVDKLISRISDATKQCSSCPKHILAKGLGLFTISEANASGKAAGRVALVTGAAQGFGLEIAQDLAGQGGYVALCDINEVGAQAAAAAINDSMSATRAIAVAMNVTDGDSVEKAIHQVVCTWGGFDLFISNAGILKAESVKTQPLKDFDSVTAVNYRGYFMCVQKAAPVLAMQHLARPDYWSDIIQINSKSGLAGSNRNAAYAGSKFGGIGLTQSFAMELVDDGIKVNSICPGNYFDGPLWSDPDNGLFVQYLRAKKIPDATTIADVRHAYEAKVPMGRGCETSDVMKAIYYLMEQKYETGQALPVTGGQVMLR
jgi:sorbitol-6-phosphate 2-dehydrogenase